ncbi:1-deoxy-D-xylulose-5-phosphate reductoisomerase [bacterium]|nr:1-deoxy-D-xylulose-5-phosphate reductoisomerase [bacterium]
MQKILLLGSTGSIGENVLNIVRTQKEFYKIIGISAKNRSKELVQQALEFNPDFVLIGNEQLFSEVKNALAHTKIQVFSGEQNLAKLVRECDFDLLFNSLVGSVGVLPTIESLKKGKDVALANKETLVVAGEFVMNLARQKKAFVRPVDSEHSAIWQCLVGENEKEIDKLIITASGGPFRTLPKEKFANVTVQEALNHPNWKMGNKITIDSATLMNKGFEVIEAYHFFGNVKVEVVVHPQSIIHSMVEFCDGSVKAQLGIPDMKIPIQFALSYPKRWKSEFERMDLAKIGKLTFELPDFEKFRCLKLALDCLESGGTSACVLNAANEIAVEYFLKEKIRFTQIPEMIEKSLEKHEFFSHPSVEMLLEIDLRTRNFVRKEIEKLC